MAGKDDSIRLSVDLDLKQALAEVQEEMLGLKRNFESQPIKVDFNVAYEKLDKLLEIFGKLVKEKEKLEKRNEKSALTDANDIRRLETLLSIIPRVSKELQSAGSAAEGMAIKTSRLTDSISKTSSKSQHEDAKRLLSLYDQIQAKVKAIQHTQSMGKSVSASRTGELQKMLLDFEATQKSIQKFIGKKGSPSGGGVSFAELPHEMAKSLTDALSKTKAGLGQFTQMFERSLNVESKRSLDKFEKMVDERVAQVRGKLAGNLSTIKSAHADTLLINQPIYRGGLGSATSADKWFEKQLAPLQGATDRESIQQRMYLNEQRARVALEAANYREQVARLRANKSNMLTGGAQEVIGVLPRAQAVRSVAHNIIGNQGARLEELLGRGLTTEDAISKLNLRNNSALRTLKQYLELVQKQLKDIEAEKIPASSKVIKDLKKFAKETASEIKDLEQTSISATANRTRLHQLAGNNLAPQRKGVLGALMTGISGSRAFAGMSDSDLAGHGQFLMDQLSRGDLSEEERSMARRSLNSLDARQRMIRRMGNKGRMFSNPLMLGIGMPLLFGMRPGFGALHPELGGYGAGGGFGGTGGGAYGRRYGGAFNYANAMVSHTSALLGTPLYGMGLAGAAMAGVGGAIKLSSDAQMQKLGLAGMFNTFMKFNKASSPMQNLVTSQAYSQDMYKQIREVAKGSSLTTSELFQYYMTAAGPGLGRKINPEKLISMVSRMASLGKMMGLQERDVVQDVRATLSGDIRQSNKIGTVLGFKGPEVKATFAKGPEEFEKYFEEKMKGISAAMKLIPDTFQGAMNKVWNALQQTGISVGDKITGKVNLPLKNLSKVLDTLAENGGLDKLASAIGNGLSAVIDGLAGFANHVGDIFNNLQGIFTTFVSVMGGVMLFKVGIAISGWLASLATAVTGVKTSTTGLTTVTLGFIAVLVAFVGNMIALKKQAEDAIIQKSENLGRLQYGKFDDLSSQEQTSVLNVLADQAAGKPAGTVRLFGKDLGPKELQQYLPNVDPRVLESMRSYGQSLLGDLSGLMRQGASAIDWYKSTNTGATDAEAVDAVTKLYAQGKTPWHGGSKPVIVGGKNIETPSMGGDDSAAQNKQTDMAVAGLLLDKIGKAVDEAKGGKGAGLIASGNLQARAGAYKQILEEAGIRLPQGPHTGEHDGVVSNEGYIIDFVKGLTGKEKEKFNKALSMYQTGKNKFAYTPQGGITPDAAKVKTPALSVSSTTYDALLSKNADYQLARIGHMLDATPDLAMQGGKYIKPQMFTSQFNLGVQAAGAQLSEVISKGGNANDVKIATLQYAQTIEDLRAKYELNIKAVQENIEAQKAQTEAIKANIEASKVELALRLNQAQRGNIQADSIGGLNALMTNVMQGLSLEGTAGGIEFGSKMAGYASANKRNMIKYGPFSFTGAGALSGASASPDMLGLINSFGISESVTTKAQRAGGLYLGQDLLGAKYKWGSSGDGAMDCSAFTGKVAARNGIALPRTANEQMKASTPINAEDLAVGDLIFFDYNKKGNAKGVGGAGIADHVVMYLGDGKVRGSGRGGVKDQTLSGMGTPMAYGRVLGGAPGFKTSPGYKLSARFGDQDAVMKAVLAQSMGIPIGPDGNIDMAEYLSKVNSEQEQQKMLDRQHLYGSRVMSYLGAGQEGFGGMQQFTLGYGGIGGRQARMQDSLNLLGLGGADLAGMQRLNAASEGVRFGQYQYGAGINRANVTYGNQLAGMAKAMPVIEGLFGKNIANQLFEGFIRDAGKAFDTTANLLYETFIQIPAQIDADIKRREARRQANVASDYEFKGMISSQWASKAIGDLQSADEAQNNLGNLGYFTPNAISQRKMTRDLGDVDNKVAVAKNRYAKILRALHPDMSENEIASRTDAMGNRMSVNLRKDIFNGPGNTLKDQWDTARMGTLGNLSQSLMTNPMQLTSLSGMAGAFLQAGGPLQDMLNNTNSTYMNVLMGGSKSEAMTAFLASPLATKYGIKDAKGARNLAGKVMGANIAGSFLGNWLGTQIGGDPAAVSTGSTIGGMLGGAGVFGSALGPYGAAVGMLAGGLLGGLFGKKHEVDPREEQYRRRVEELLSSIDKNLMPQNDYFRTIGRDALFGSASRMLSGRYNTGVVILGQRV